MTTEFGSAIRFNRIQEVTLNPKGSNCGECKEMHFPPRIICPDCGYNNHSHIHGEIDSERVDPENHIDTPVTPRVDSSG